MSILSKALGIHVKVPVLRQIGGVVDRNLPVIGGVALGLGGQLAGHLLQGQNIGEAVGKIGGEAVSGAERTAALLGSGLIPGVGGAVGAAADATPVAASTVGGGASNGLLGTVGGLIKSAGQYAIKNPGTILTAAQGINSALDAASARALEKKAMGYATDDYAARAPLRSAGVAGLLAPPVDLTQSRAYQSPGNAYAAQGSKATNRILGVTRRQASS